ncbi:MAG: branched-chain alpha-keto dehydrogenase complex dihydrolipoyllysine-residue (2-methylpropanoyl)transferase [Vulcanimicrobiaceae bacterium]
MATTITMPQLGETVTEGTVAQWLKKPGDAIDKYEAFVEVSTDKVNAEVPSPVSGILREIICREGETGATGAPSAIIDELGTASPAAPAEPAAGVPASYGAPGTSNGAARPSNGASPAGGQLERDAPGVLRGVSPAVRRLAREHNVDVAALSGTGHNGRVTANDVVAAAAHAGPAIGVAVAAAPATPRAVTSASGTSTYAKPQRGTTVPLSHARKIIAQRMVESLDTAPHAWTMVEVDVTGVWAWRAREKERFARDKGYALTLLPFFIYAVVRGLEAQPLLNARFTDDGILVHRDIDVGIAIGLDSNLVVPVIRAADTRTIGGLAVAAGELIERARSAKLGADDLAGGTFTVNNTGANGSILSKPIINGGQAGIVTMEAVVKRPVVIGDAIAIRSMMNVCLSLDHRVIDGTIANAFLAEVKGRLEAMGPTGDL